MEIICFLRQDIGDKTLYHYNLHTTTKSQTKASSKQFYYLHEIKQTELMSVKLDKFKIDMPDTFSKQLQSDNCIGIV